MGLSQVKPRNLGTMKSPQRNLATQSGCIMGTRKEMVLSEKEAIKEASEEFSHEFKSLVNAQDLDSLKQLQLLILGRLQDSNAVLSHFNEYSEHCYAEVSGDFSRNTRLLKSMKTDLDYIFQKLRSMKAKILATYPDAFPEDSKSELLDRRPDLEIP